MGFNRLFQKGRVIGYETDGPQRRFAAGLARINGVGIEIRGAADHRALIAVPDGHLMIMFDARDTSVSSSTRHSRRGFVTRPCSSKCIRWSIRTSSRI